MRVAVAAAALEQTNCCCCSLVMDTTLAAVAAGSHFDSALMGSHFLDKGHDLAQTD